MGNISKCDFYCNLDELEKLEFTYRTATNELLDMFLEFEAVIDENSGRDYWKGKAYEAFETSFGRWKEDFVRIMASMTLLDGTLASIFVKMTELTQKRDNLENAIDIL